MPYIHAVQRNACWSGVRIQLTFKCCQLKSAEAMQRRSLQTIDLPLYIYPLLQNEFMFAALHTLHFWGDFKAAFTWMSKNIYILICCCHFTFTPFKVDTENRYQHSTEKGKERALISNVLCFAGWVIYSGVLGIPYDPDAFLLKYIQPRMYRLVWTPVVQLKSQLVRVLERIWNGRP